MKVEVYRVEVDVQVKETRETPTSTSTLELQFTDYLMHNNERTPVDYAQSEIIALTLEYRNECLTKFIGKQRVRQLSKVLFDHVSDIVRLRTVEIQATSRITTLY